MYYAKELTDESEQLRKENEIMGTRHWPEDADEYVEELEVDLESLRTQLAKANERIAKLESLVQECDDYLDINRYTAIGNMSILHRKMKEMRKD